MRYYRLEFFNPKTGKAPDSLTANNNRYSVFESHPNGIFNPGCPEISFDCLLTEGSVAQQPFHITLHNVPKELLGEARTYNALNCNLYAGFKSGLPLAKPNQSGLIVSGTVQGCYGNWAGTNLTMDFLINPMQTFGSPALNLSANVYTSTPQQFAFTWTPPSKGTGSTFIQALNSFFSSLGYNGCIGSLDVNKEWNLDNMPRFSLVYSTFGQFCVALQRVTQQQNAPNKINPEVAKDNRNLGNFQTYRGVELSIDTTTNTVIAWDGTSSAPSGVTPQQTAIDLQLDEFIGQPTWISSSGVIQSIHPMRNDIRVTSYVNYPNKLGQNIIVPAQYTKASLFDYFNGENLSLYVKRVRHVGRFRDPNPTAWVTYIDGYGGLRENAKVLTTGEVTIGQVETIF